MTDRLATGELLGSILDDRYTVQELIGRGGMAAVYRAWDAELHRTVAIKVLHGGAEPGADDLRRVREARALASINHPALVTLFDAVIRDDRSYLVMELVDGVTLRGQIAMGPLDSRDVAVIAHDLADGLHAVHARGIIHRDIKPANILLAETTVPTQRFRAKLSDFGIALFSDATRVTSPGLFLGTASYISPEQAQGLEPAPPADIYALGLTLLEALTGRSAFVGGALEVVSARLSRDPQVPAWLGAEWSHLLTWMTEREPSARPTAIEVAAAARSIPPIHREPSDIPVSTGALETAASTVSVMTEPTLADNRAEKTTSELTAILRPLADPTGAGAVHGADGSAEAVAKTGVDSVPEAERSGRWHRPALIMLAVGLVVIALLAIGAALLRTSELDVAPNPTPTLPSLPAPLDQDMKDLLDGVTS